MSSFFGKKTIKAEVIQRQNSVVGSGGQVDEIVQALIAAANDGNEGVKNTIVDSLTDMGRFKPDLILSSCNDFVLKNPKASKDHVVFCSTWSKKYWERKRTKYNTTWA